jgi:hypothetical protein
MEKNIKDKKVTGRIITKICSICHYLLSSLQEKFKERSMNTKALIKQLKIEKGCNYLIFVSKNTGLFPEDLESIPLHELGADKYFFVYVEGNVAKLVKKIKINK